MHIFVDKTLNSIKLGFIKIYTFFVAMLRVDNYTCGIQHVNNRLYEKEGKMPLTNADKVADYILCYFHDIGEEITNLKIQKLIYYAQGWFLGIHGEPLFSDELEAWRHGPVQPEVYQRFKDFKFNPITEEPDCPAFSEKRIRKILDYIIDRYGCYSPFELKKMTHKEQPWIDARRGLAPTENGRETIENDSMMKFFEATLLQEEYKEDQAFIAESERCLSQASLDEENKDC